MAEENNELESENLSNNFEEEKISENESSLNENSEMADESSARRLSLFDSLSSKNLTFLRKIIHHRKSQNLF